MAQPKAPKREEVIKAKLVESGFEPNERQLAWAVAFCTPGRCFRDSVKAARVAGYPDPEQGGDMCFAEMGQLLDGLIKLEETGPLYVLQRLYELTNAKTTKIVAHMGMVTDEVTLEDNGTQLGALKALMDYHGMAAPTKSETVMSFKSIAEQLAEAQARGDGYGE